MKVFILSIIIVTYSVVQAQEVTQEALFDSIVNVVGESYSKLGKEAFCKVDSTDFNSKTLNISYINKTGVSLIKESFVFDLNNVSDVYSAPTGKNTFTVIVSLKKSVLITKITTEYENLFHEELTSENLREDADLWFIFNNGTDANNLEKWLMQLKN